MGVLPDYMIKQQVEIKPFDDGRAKPGRISSGLSSYGYDARLGYDFKVFSPALCPEVDPKAFDPRALVSVNLWPVCHSFVLDKGATMRDPKAMFECEACNLKVNNGSAAKKIEDMEPCPAARQPDNFARIPPNSFALAETLETFKIPRDVLAVCVGKSTYARCGIVVNVTPLEPEWEGKVTVEISNTSPLPARVYAGEGIMQIMFFRSDGVSAALRKVINEDMALPIVVKYGNYLRKMATCTTSYADKKGKYQGQKGLTLPTVTREVTDGGHGDTQGVDRPGGDQENP